MLKVEDLTAHMNKFKDAVIIMGPGVGPHRETVPTGDQLAESYTHKCMRRTPDKFWAFFKEYIYVSPETVPTVAMEKISLLNSLGIVSEVITQNTDGIYKFHCGSQNLIELHGDSSTFTCMKCKTQYTHQYYESLMEQVPMCEQCGGSLRPNTVLYGNNYKDEVFDAFKYHLIKTHTLILAGIDFNEDPIVSLVADYSDIKDVAIQSGKPEERRMLVTIGKPTNYSLDEVGKFEFVVDDDCGAALTRMTDAFRG